jgi:cytochrome c5
MTMKIKSLFTLLIVVILSLVLVQCGGSAPSTIPTTESAAQTNPTSSNSGTTLDAATFTEQTCSQCHTFSRAQNAGRSSAEWATTVDRMISHGLSVTPEERQTIIDYLALTYP